MPRLRAAFAFPMLAALLTAGCNKSGPPAGGGSSATTAGVAVNKRAAYDATRLLADLKAANTPEKRTKAIQRAMEMDEAGENVVPTLLDALKDKTAGTLGHTSERPDSTRETAVQALLSLKEKGKRALLDSGLKTLESGLSDKEPNVREHTVNAIGMIGPDAKDAAEKVCKLCADREKEVRGAAYRTLQKFKSFDPSPILRLLLSQNLDVAGEAAAALEWIKPNGPQYVQALLAAVQREARQKEEPSDVRFVQNAAAQALANIGKGAESAVPALVELLIKAKMEDVEKMIRPAKEGENASNFSGPVLALRRIGKPAVPAVVPLLKHNDPLVRYQVAAVLSGMNKADAAESLPQIQEALEAERGLPTGQMYVFEELAAATINHGGDLEKVLKPIIELLKSDEAGSRYRAARLVARVGRKGAPAVPRLTELLGDSSKSVQIAAAEALGAIGPDAKEAVIELGKKVGGEEVDLARAAAQALRNIGPAAAPAAGLLAKGLDANDQSLCIDTAQAIGAIGPEATGALDAIAKHLGEDNSNREERIALLQATAAIGPSAKDVIPNVTKLVGDKDAGVRAAAMETLAKIAPGSPEAVKTLADLLKDSKLSPLVQIAALKALGGMGAGAKSAAGDVKAFQDQTKDPPARVWAAAALVALGTDTDVNTKVVVAAIKDVNAQGKPGPTRMAGIESAELLGPKGKPAVPELIEALKDKSSPGRGDAVPVRERAARTLGKLGPVAKDAVKPLTELLRDSERTMRRAAVEALGSFGPEAASAAPKLREVSRTDAELAPAIQAALDRIEPMKKAE